jgi:urea transport system permease protein
MEAVKSRLLQIHGAKGWTALGISTLLLCVLMPALNLFVSPDSPIHAPDYLIALLGKFLCFAIVAVAMDLIWGYTGILSLGHGVFFAFGGYAMGMYMMRSMAGEGVYRSELPDYMVFLAW